MYRRRLREERYEVCGRSSTEPGSPGAVGALSRLRFGSMLRGAIGGINLHPYGPAPSAIDRNRASFWTLLREERYWGKHFDGQFQGSQSDRWTTPNLHPVPVRDRCRIQMPSFGSQGALIDACHEAKSRLRGALIGDHANGRQARKSDRRRGHRYKTQGGSARER